MPSICTENRRVLILVDYFEGQTVHEEQQQPPLVDAIPAPPTDWANDRLLHQLANTWAEAMASYGHISQPRRSSTYRGGLNIQRYQIHSFP